MTKSLAFQSPDGSAPPSASYGSVPPGSTSPSRTLILKNTGTLLNSTVLGSDITGTIAGNDSLSIAALTLQTSTVYGGAGNDTIIFGSTNTNTQIVDVTFNAFAGADSINAVGSFVSTTVNAGSGNDTMFVNTSTAGVLASSDTQFYAGTGADRAPAPGTRGHPGFRAGDGP